MIETNIFYLYYNIVIVFRELLRFLNLKFAHLHKEDTK
jgi:hypothetical protein